MKEQPEPNVIHVGANLVANSAAIINESLTTIYKNSVVELDTGEVEVSTKKKKKASKGLSSNFKIILSVVVGLTLLSILIKIGLAIFGHEPPRGFEQSLSDSADYGWKLGLGALFGLLTGKQI
jgi:hypothetical protein